MIACCGWPLGGFSHLNDGHEGTTGDCRNVHGNDIGQVAAQRVQDFAFAGNAANQDVIRGGTRCNGMKYCVTPHINAFGDKDVFRATVGGVACKLAEWPFRLANIVEDLPFDDDFRTFGHVKLSGSAARNAVRLIEQGADDFVFRTFGG
jgi:hypothetical protein